MHAARRSVVALAALLLIAAFGAPEAAFAQWRSYGGYEAYPFYPPAPLPAYPDYPLPPGARPYGSQPVARGGDPYYGGYYPDAEPRGEAYEPHGGDPRSSELAVNHNQRTAMVVPNPTNEPPGTIVIDTRSRHLYLVQPGGRAIQYGIGVGRQGFEWKGTARIGRKAEWPRWIPPKEMLARRPDLPESMEGGLENPLGARALYLYQGNKDTLFRIHGTNEPNTIGQAVSSGCIRMMNADVMDLYERVGVGVRVVVL
ncbi:L,D-transpeptidase [Methylocella silvestris]|uniref:L,D-transpeptidase n=1 Tax=Methylocella silvestris TaxID=199596 RepID=A0A2J7TM72_METSI|nr:L,D-transpeptidase [Methylocella silvestris]PNG27878.1 L,D-transpeptidase [Methylocella silvestris]